MYVFILLGPVCENLYLDIMRASGGPIIWGYLKPIIRGKILFSPNNDVTRTIVQEVSLLFNPVCGERSGSVVECLTRDQAAVG